jgi:hypothetical protein
MIQFLAKAAVVQFCTAATSRAGEGGTMADRYCWVLRLMLALVSAGIPGGFAGHASASQLQFNLQAVVPLACTVIGTRITSPNVLEVDAVCNAERFSIAVGDGFDGRRIIGVDTTNAARVTFENKTISVVASRPGQYRMAIAFAAPIGAQESIPVSLIL